jgi:3-phosphoshikimate 1-carboxyvinyltransferase
MPLPDLIEIVPLTSPVQAKITVPGSKSITNRALVLAALAEGETRLNGALWSQDTQVMIQGLKTLGFVVQASADPLQPCNRDITVAGSGGQVAPGGAAKTPLELFVGNAGTAARFLTAMVCLGHGTYRLHGVARMHERPQAALFEALRQMGYRVESLNNKLPALIHGAGPRPGACRVSMAESSQFASALLLCAKAGGWAVEVVGENTDESPYVAMTRQLCAVFPRHGGTFQIEPDASSGSYFWAANYLLGSRCNRADFGIEPAIVAVRHPHRESAITVTNWPKSGWQIDADFPRYLPLLETVSRQRHLGDSIMTAIVLGPWAEYPVSFTDLGRLRLQECERVAALRLELTKCGAKVQEQGDTLTVFPSAANLHGAEIETYGDHRMAMCFAILGLVVAGIKIKQPGCVRKTFPDFFQKLAASPPAGLGATILNGAGRLLQPHELLDEQMLS